MQDTAASLYDMSEYTLEYDLLKVNVFYNSLMEKTITDEKDYDVTVCICMVGLLKNFSPQDGSFFSALGGSISLWLGISFCALFELVEI